MTGERLDYAILISLATREEAEVVAAALRADGVDAFIGNSNHAYADWFYTVALGGLQIMVPSPKTTEARMLLRERIQENAGEPREDAASRRDRWKLWIIGLLWSPVLLVALAGVWVSARLTRSRTETKAEI